MIGYWCEKSPNDPKVATGHMRITASFDLFARTCRGRRACSKWQAPDDGAWRDAAATTLSERAVATATARLERWDALIIGRGVPKATDAYSAEVEPWRPDAQSRSDVF